MMVPLCERGSLFTAAAHDSRWVLLCPGAWQMLRRTCSCLLSRWHREAGPPEEGTSSAHVPGEKGSGAWRSGHGAGVLGGVAWLPCPVLPVPTRGWAAFLIVVLLCSSLLQEFGFVPVVIGGRGKRGSAVGLRGCLLLAVVSPTESC